MIALPVRLYRRILRVITWILLLVTVGNAQIQGASVSWLQNMLANGDDYARRGDWKNAVVQYYNIFYSFPPDSIPYQLYFKIAAVYSHNGQPQLARPYLVRAAERYRATRYDLECRLRLAVFDYQYDADEEAVLRSVLAQPEIPFKVIAAYLLIRMNAIDLADSMLSVVLASRLMVTDQIEALQAALRQPPPEPYPVWQKWGIIGSAAILPGMPQLLSGDYREGGLIATGFIALFGISRRISARHAAVRYFGTTGLLFYYLGGWYAGYRAYQDRQAAGRSVYYADLVRRFAITGVLKLADPLMSETVYER